MKQDVNIGGDVKTHLVPAHIERCDPMKSVVTMTAVIALAIAFVQSAVAAYMPRPKEEDHQHTSFKAGLVPDGDDEITDVSGLSLGVLVDQAAIVRGLQLSLFAVVNLADREDGESLALINLVHGGIHEVAVYTSDTMFTNVALRLGGRHLYTVHIAAFHPGTDISSGPERLERNSRRSAVGLGVGWRFLTGISRMEALEVEGGMLAVHAGIFEHWVDPT